ncbi:hypothetical protein [Halalkalicoccus salilacus]|uniref:hypothetical protein n=1 Tax=Halalkalicoccus sp. GCM10025704 TaxID=3252662 RepID=UPI00361D1DB1
MDLDVDLDGVAALVLDHPEDEPAALTTDRAADRVSDGLFRDLSGRELPDGPFDDEPAGHLADQFAHLFEVHRLRVAGREPVEVDGVGELRERVGGERRLESLL